MSERISDEDTKQLQHLIFLCQSKSSQFISLIPDPQTANEILLTYLRKLASKYNCDYKEIMSDGEIRRLQGV